MGVLALEVPFYKGPSRWAWRLTEPGGGLVADHEVRLDTTCAEYEAFVALDRYLRWNAAPDRRLASEAEICERVGRWIGSQVLGPVGPAIVTRRPVTVRLRLPAQAQVLGHWPLELAWVGDRPLALQQVSLVVEPCAGGGTAVKAPVGERLRMLAVFSLPVDAGALNLRRERYALTRLVHRIAQVNGKAIELRVLQYGVTRERLDEVLLEGEGWDVVHVSGHGLAGGLLLEHADGRHDLVSSTELVDLLEPAREQIKLVTMSSCDSAAVTAAEQLRLLGIATAQPSGDDDGDAALPAVATALVRRLGCAVLAMRYPVGDEFAIGLAGQLYDLVLGKGQALPRALGLALPRLCAPGPVGLSVATPALFGAQAAELRLRPPAGAPVVFDAANVKLADFLPEPERFVGRAGPMARATAALAPDSDAAGVLFFGMAGAGKTACALELAYGHEQVFSNLAWHKAPDADQDITAALTNLALDLERQLPGLQMVRVVDDVAALRAFLPRLTQLLERNRVLVVVDNLESLLDERGGWRDPRWGLVIDALVRHGGLSRVVLMSRHRPRVLDARVRVEPIHALSLAEAMLMARELPNLRALMHSDAGRSLLSRTLAVVQGHPKLIELANGHAADPATLEARLAEADRAWLAGGARLDAFFEQGESAATDQDYLHVLNGWTRATADGLPAPSRLLFSFLCALEEADRVHGLLEVTWGDLWRRLELAGEPPDLETAVAPLVAHGLVAVEPGDDPWWTAYRLHPGVAEAGRAAGPGFQTAVDSELAAYWVTAFQTALAQEAEGKGWLVLHAGRAAAPYLLRLQAWDAAGEVLSDVLNRDPSPSTVAALLPLLRRIVEATSDTDEELDHGRTLARALSFVQPAEAERHLRELLATAVSRERFVTASGLALDLVNLLREVGRLDEALTLAEQMKEHTRRAGLGPWTQLADEGVRLQILAAQGHSEEVLTAVTALRDTMAALPEDGDARELTVPWNVREGILDTGHTAACDLGRWEEAVALNAERLESKRRREVRPSSSPGDGSTTTARCCAAAASRKPKRCSSPAGRCSSASARSGTSAVCSAPSPTSRTSSSTMTAPSGWKETRCATSTLRGSLRISR